jgi:predicted nucleic acid-binding protein
MKGFLLDTDIISLLSPGQEKLPEVFLDWLTEMDGREKIFISVITIQEIKKAIALLERHADTSRVVLMDLWLNKLLADHRERILDIDTATASVAGHLEARALATGHSVRLADALLAGTAVTHDLTIVSTQPRPFMSCGVKAIAPKEASKLM